MSIIANANITITNVNDGANGTNGYKVLRATSSNSRNYSSATWATYGAEGHVDSWTSITNASSFVPGDTMVVSGTISDRNGIGCVLYTRVNSISGTTVNATSYSFIAGERGNPGANGSNGTNGTNGLNSYFHIKYSANADGNPMSETPDTYIGTYVDNTLADSNTYTDYTWARFQGIQGPNGTNGINGSKVLVANTSIRNYTQSEWNVFGAVGYNVNWTAITNSSSFAVGDIMIIRGTISDHSGSSCSLFATVTSKSGTTVYATTYAFISSGETPYMHIAYATSADGSTGFSTTDSVNKTYMGQCTNFSQTDPITPSSYTWSRVKGDQLMIQYGLSTSNITPPVELPLGYEEGDTISFNGQEVLVSWAWSDYKPPTPQGLFMWQRQKYPSDTEWMVFCLTGEALVYKLISNKTIITKNMRSSGSETIIFTYDIQGYGGTSPRISFDHGSTFHDFVLDEDDNNKPYYTYFVNHNEATDFTAKLYNDTTLMDSVFITVMDITEYGHYYGVYPMTILGINYNTPSDYNSNTCVVGDSFLTSDGTPKKLSSIDAGTYIWEATEDKDVWLKALDGGFLNTITGNQLDNGFITWMKNLVVNNLATKSLMAENLRVREGGMLWGSSNTGAPTPVLSNGVYQFGANESGFVIDSEGHMQAKDAYFESVEINDKSVVKGTIENTGIFKTVLSAAGTNVISGSNGSTAYHRVEEWRTYINNTYTGVGFGTGTFVFNGTTYNEIRRMTSVAGNTYTERVGINSEDFTVNMLTNESYYRSVAVANIHARESASFNWFGNGNSGGILIRLINIDSGNVVSTLVNVPSDRSGGNAQVSEKGWSSFTVPPRCKLQCILSNGYGYSANNWSPYINWYYNESAYWGVGLNMVTTNGGLTMLNNVSVPTWSSAVETFSGGGASISTNSLTQYYHLNFTNVPLGNGSASTFSAKSFIFNGTTISTITRIEYTPTSIKLITSSLEIYEFSTTSFTRSGAYSFSFTIISTPVGAYASDIYPIDNGNVAHTIGASEKKFSDMYATTMHANTFDNLSTRASKRNIVAYSRKAEELLNSVAVVEYNYKSDLTEKKKIGFIADETDSDLSGEYMEAMDIGNCIGVLIKVAQELSAKVTALEAEIETLKEN